jgi:mannitol 2-dehydrogenase
MKRSSSSPLPPVEPKRAFTSRKSTESFGNSKHQSNDQNTKHDTINETTSGIVHIGCGNFHRSHQESYLNELLATNFEENKSWLYTGISVLKQDSSLKEKLKKNNYKYHLISLDEKGDANVEWVQSLKDFMVTDESLNACLDLLSSDDIKIVSLTITEFGYTVKLSETDVKIVSTILNNDPSFAINFDDKGVTAFGLIVISLAIRYKRGMRPFTIMSCDNLLTNGDVCKNKCMNDLSSISKLCPRGDSFMQWVQDEVCFPNSMVDRITPYISDEEIVEIDKQYGIIDLSPVVCEQYKSWIIEDSFVDNKRPRWEDVGSILTTDVKPYERMKLSLLNIHHSFVAYIGLKHDYTFVHEVVNDESLLPDILEFLHDNIIPILLSTECGELTSSDYVGYANEVLERFKNQHMKDRLARIATDGRNKFESQTLPLIIIGIENGFQMEKFRDFIDNWMLYDSSIKVDDALFDPIRAWLNDN